MIKVITYYLMILSSTPSEYFPDGQTLILPFENQEVCQAATKDLVGYLADDQCPPSIMREVLKMTPPNQGLTQEVLLELNLMLIF